MPPIPTKIKLAAGGNTLAVHWSDGHESAYPYRYLRGKCPCATCDEAAPVAEEAVGGLPILGQKPLHPERAELVGPLRSANLLERWTLERHLLFPVLAQPVPVPRMYDGPLRRALARLQNVEPAVRLASTLAPGGFCVATPSIVKQHKPVIEVARSME